MSRPNGGSREEDRPDAGELPREDAVRAPDFETLRQLVLHGHEVFYRSAGSGPVIVLVHGITSTSRTWANVLPALAEHFTVIAPDLLGHGESAKPRGDYSLGAYASGIRDLLVALGHERATFVGHSLGGGVAMQLAYQFPEHCDRLVLVSSGGLGREITALLRAASLPGSELVLPLLAHEQLIAAGRAVGRLLGRIGLRVHTDVGEVLRGHASLADGAARSAFVHTLRTIVDARGQRVDASDVSTSPRRSRFCWCGASATRSSRSSMRARPTGWSREADWRSSPTRAISPTSTIRCGSSGC
jgi:pimeloyl-ACP methyl ester carboxylesterase